MSKSKRNALFVAISIAVLGAILLQYLTYPRIAGAGLNSLTPTMPFGLRITSIAVSPAFPCDSTVFFSTDGEGVFRTSDNDVDAVWFPINNGLTNLNVLSVAISPNFDRCDRLRGTGDNTLFAATRDGVFKSRDGGASWAPVGTGLPTGRPTQAIAVSPNYASDNTLFVGMDGSLYRSTDNGLSWLPFDAGLTDRSVQAFAASTNFANDSTLFLGTRFSGVYRIAGKLSTTPGGESAPPPLSTATPQPAATPGTTPTAAATPRSTSSSPGGDPVHRSGETEQWRIASRSCVSGSEGIRMIVWAGNAADGSTYRTSSGPVEFTYEVTNIGTTALFSIIINDDNGTPSDSSDDININNLVGGGSFLSLGPGSVLVFTTPIPVNRSSTHTGTATGFFGADLSSSISCSDDAAVQVVTGGPQASMRLVLRAGNAADGALLITSPGPVTYTYEIRNTGDVSLSDIAVMDDNGTTDTMADDIHVGSVAVLPAGGNTTLSLSAQVNADRTNRGTATARFGPGFADTITATDTAEVQVVTSQPIRGLKLIKTAGNVADGQIYYTVPGPVILTYTLINEGQETLTNITVVDDLEGNDGPGCTDKPETEKFNETLDDLVVGTVSGLAPGGQATLSARIAVKPKDELATEFLPLRSTACAVGTGAVSGGPAGAVDDAVIQMVVWQSVTPTNSALTDLWITSFAVSPFFGNDQTVFAGTAYGGLFKSRNAGSSQPTWVRVNQGLEPEWVYVRALALSPRYPNDRTLFVGTENGIFMGVEQSDGKVSWKEMNSGLSRRDVRAMAISPNYQVDHVVFAGVWQNDLHRLRNGSQQATWVPQRRIASGLWSWDVALTKEGVLLAGTWGRGVARNYIPGGTGWTYPSLPGADGAEVTAVKVSPGFCSGYTVMAGTWSHGLYKSIDAGGSWERVTSFPSSLPVRDILFSSNFPKDGTVFVASWGGGVYKSTDMGATWSSMNDGLADLKVRSLALPPNYPQDSNIFAGTDSAGVMLWEPIISRWVPSSNGIQTSTIMSVAISPNYPNDSTLLAGTWGGGVYISNNRGSSWFRSDAGIGSPHIRSVEFSPSFPIDRQVYAGTHEGAYRSTNAASSWQRMPSENGELDSIDITGFAISGSTPNTLFVSTGGRGVWQFTEATSIASIKSIRDFQASSKVFFPIMSKDRPSGPCTE